MCHDFCTSLILFVRLIPVIVHSNWAPGHHMGTRARTFAYCVLKMSEVVHCQ